MFWNNIEKMKDNIDEVKKIIGQNLSGTKGPAEKVIEHLLLSEGKYLRSGLTILSGQLGKAQNENLLVAAAAIEMFHMATLVHDDIIDNSQTRRGMSTVGGKFGNDVAVFTGDYILSRAYSMVTDECYQFLTPLSKAVEKVCLGEMTQNYFRYNQRVTYKEYMKVITGKTAALFGLCGAVGGNISSLSDDTLKKLVLSMKNMGVAFQIKDDCSDFDLGEESLGKKPFNDIEQGVYTLPIIFGLKTSRRSQLSQILAKDTLTLEDKEQVHSILTETKALSRARYVGQRYMEKSLCQLNLVRKTIKPSHKHAGCLKAIDQIEAVYNKLGKGLHDGR